MKTTLKLLPSLFMTIVMSSLAPVIVLGLILAICSVLFSCTGISEVMPKDSLTEFLRVFGDGSAWDGIITIAITCGFVGGMFETFNFYYYQNTN